MIFISLLTCSSRRRSPGTRCHCLHHGALSRGSSWVHSRVSDRRRDERKEQEAGGRRQAGGGTPRGRLCLVMLSVSVCLLALKAQRWTRARVCVCLVARTQEDARVRGGRRVGLLFEWHQQVPQSKVRSTCCIVPASLSQLHASNSIE